MPSPQTVVRQAVGAGVGVDGVAVVALLAGLDEAVAARRRAVQALRAAVGVDWCCRRRTARRPATKPSPHAGSRQALRAAVGVDCCCRRRTARRRWTKPSPQTAQVAGVGAAVGVDRCCRRRTARRAVTMPSPQTGERCRRSMQPSPLIGVAVVALLAGLDDAVAAGGELAGVGAAVGVDGVAVVALLGRGVDDAVAAHVQACSWSCRRRSGSGCRRRTARPAAR